MPREYRLFNTELQGGGEYRKWRGKALVVFQLLTDAERGDPDLITGARVRSIALSAALPEREVNLIRAMFCTIKGMVSRVTLDDFTGSAGRDFTPGALRVLRGGETVASSMGMEFLDSPHWLVSLCKFGSGPVQQAFAGVGLQSEALLQSHLRIEGECPKMTTKAVKLPLTTHATNLLDHWLLQSTSTAQPVDEVSVALGLVSVDDNPMNGRLLSELQVRASDLLERLSILRVPPPQSLDGI